MNQLFWTRNQPTADKYKMMMMIMIMIIIFDNPSLSNFQRKAAKFTVKFMQWVPFSSLGVKKSAFVWGTIT